MHDVSVTKSVPVMVITCDPVPLRGDIAVTTRDKQLVKPAPTLTMFTAGSEQPSLAVARQVAAALFFLPDARKKWSSFNVL